MHDPAHSMEAQAAAMARAWVAIELAEANPRLRAMARERALLWLQIEQGAPFFDVGEQRQVEQVAPAAVVESAELTVSTAEVRAAPVRPSATGRGAIPFRSAGVQHGDHHGRTGHAPARAHETLRNWRNLASFIALAFAWGTSFMFIKYGLRGFTPATLVCIQSLLAAVVLWTFIKGAELRGTVGARMPGRLSRRDIIWLAVLAPAGYWAIVWGEQFIDSGIAAILTATEPLWTLVILRVLVGRADWNRVRMLGMLVGLGGVALLGYGQGTLSGGVETIGLVALLLSALLYSGLAVYVSRDLARVWYIRTAAWSVTLLALVSLPIAIMDFSEIQWRMDSVLAVIALGIFDSALGYLLFYRLVRDTGPTRAAQVNYLLPVIAVLAGGAFLGEETAALSIAAMLLILIGVWMGAHGNDTVHDVAAGERELGELSPVSPVRSDQQAAAPLAWPVDDHRTTAFGLAPQTGGGDHGRRAA